MSYERGEEGSSRSLLISLLDKIDNLEAARKAEGKTLDSNQQRLRNRLLILLGNTHFVLNEHQDALEQYNKVLGFNDKDYYALGSAAQCYNFLGNPAMAQESFNSCLTAIESSGDYYHKRERITRAVIAVLAAIAAKGCGNQSSYNHWAIEARELLGGDLTVDGFSPKFFSPITKRLVNSTELLSAI
jgi:tetratricopeptide (TPR) repeat protein